MTPIAKRTVALLRHCLRNRDGASAIEFAFLFPILLLLLAGLVDLGQGLTVRRKINQIASTSSEIIAMQSSWTEASVESILDGVSTIVQPYESDELTVLLCVLDIDSDGKATVNWSAAYGTTALSSGQDSPVEVPEDLQIADVQLVVTRVQYKLDTIFSGLFESFTGGGSYEYDQHFFIRPRNGNRITYS
ncbi:MULTISPECIES: TadE/TadG family type IV pilus assembly protein [Sinorhizobium]|uniref:TadE/TadG family type IV pilus assembly protein n=1 Tax=Sinorhizobium TaxID=28105 RepID=UPI000BE7C603|nr:MULTISPECIES: TadE/TadG family type IV pilus assembly protein [Sinorhizobium]PDT53322.1 pilus assembly protein TadG [Sinorhizobium sp. NG07B]POH29482.1 pilus assembly protein TadG [Sinorhizobium americanum]